MIWPVNRAMRESPHKTLWCHRFGVNYTPTRRWYYSWNDWDTAAVRRDLDAIADLNADHIRVFAIWPYFQPNPTLVSPTHLDRLSELMDLAEERGLDVCVALLNGWLSGYRFVPDFIDPATFYSNSDYEEPVERYIAAIVDAVGRKSNLLGFDLGNELNCVFTTSQTHEGDRWMNHWMGWLETRCPHGVHVNGVDHQPWFKPTTFSPQALAARPSMIALHSWIKFTGALKRCGPMDPCCRSLAAAMAHLARAYAANHERPIWVQEFGSSDEWMEPKSIPDFLEAATRDAIEAGVSWFTWWASHDLDSALTFHDMEYSMGLLDTDNNCKPQGEAFRCLAKSFGGRKVDCRSIRLPSAPTIHNDEATWAWLDSWIHNSSRA